MNNVRKRTRTGCLTCRTRRVKCDERKPTCARCEAANIECAGFTKRRRLEIRQPSNDVNANASLSPSDSPSAKYKHSGTPGIRFRADGLPLVALPNNPNPSQRPHTRARDILAFHQFLFRTWPILFPFDSDCLWRDHLCESAWETEYVYDAIIALGCIHRATLLLSQQSQNDRDRGLDTKVIAVQIYTKALQGLSKELAKNGTSMDLVVGALVLFAYFEVLYPLALRDGETTC